ncbi:hypothetical protein H5410_022674 [Solanum commersonii]|uniref:Uncharacterized protein n=1 Tax=Solanum commersonii TaxID=4109 RepID=A0A9J5ZES0_SOLCO|nr:hypothetical protein H5410_022674 [Solanum commersonii]
MNEQPDEGFDFIWHFYPPSSREVSTLILGICSFSVSVVHGIDEVKGMFPSEAFARITLLVILRKLVSHPLSLHVIVDVLEITMDKSRMENGEAQVPAKRIANLNIEDVRAHGLVLKGAVLREDDF